MRMRRLILILRPRLHFGRVIGFAGEGPWDVEDQDLSQVANDLVSYIQRHPKTQVKEIVVRLDCDVSWPQTMRGLAQIARIMGAIKRRRL